MSLEVEPAQYIQIDLFPAQVEVDGDSLGEDNKIVVTDNMVYVIKHGPVDPYIVFQAPTTRALFDRTSITEYTVGTTDGHVVTFRRARNCGCGNRLRGVHPFPGIPYAPQKTIVKK